MDTYGILWLNSSRFMMLRQAGQAETDPDPRETDPPTISGVVLSFERHHCSDSAWLAMIVVRHDY